MERWRDTTLATKWRVLLYVTDYTRLNGYSPTYLEIASAMNVTGRTSITRHLRSLEKLGWIELLPGKTRGIRVCAEYIGDLAMDSGAWQDGNLKTPLRVLLYIRAYTETHREGATVTKIAAALSVTRRAVNKALKVLHQAGVITSLPRRANTIRLVYPLEKAS